ncbi:putative oxidoreductase YxbG [Colletotrichum spaethianum]|uniref:Oxidoreductase YxbG n=1 Tax=Colletotrichum spaethianum TaxID=700344 RepID=A0AA37L3Q9_9PEZI|nr:putative oxidoreductase YxbG [Colletotrichum spaethianum]GKT41398.1 putative oxidoreductase YxbG [Colletotrichum spaethianum]
MASLLRGTAFITGAASGIGKQTALAFAKNGITRLALADVNREALQATSNLLRRQYRAVEVLDLPIDVRNASEVTIGIAEAVSCFGRLDVAVNNAGIGGSGRSTHETDEDEFVRVVDIDLYGVLRCQREEIKVMLRQEYAQRVPKVSVKVAALIDLGFRRGRGAIINVASVLGVVSPAPFMFQTAYSTAKHGVMGLTKSDANTYGPRGIRINAVCPGFISTPINLAQAQESGGALDRYIENTPLKRLGTVEEVADCEASYSFHHVFLLGRLTELTRTTGIVFLASDMSSFMQGTGLVADGGLTAH